MAKDILCMLASSDAIHSSRGVAATLGVDWGNIKRGLMKRQLLEFSGTAFWLSSRRTLRSDAISEESKNIIIAWWTNETQVSPNFKDVKRRLQGAKDWLEFYTMFKGKYPTIKVGFPKFHLLKPWFVRRLEQWNTCCCRYHTELKYLLDFVIDMQNDALGVHESCECTCIAVCGQGCLPEGKTCIARSTLFTGLTSLWSSVLCEKGPNDSWHKMACINGDCSECGPHRYLCVCSEELTSEKLVKWRCFRYEVVGTIAQGKERKMVVVEHKETTPTELLKFLDLKLKFFIKHNFLAQWQDMEFRAQ